MIYVLVYPVFDERSTVLIRAFRETHEAQRARLVAPHITLVFGVAQTHLERLSRLVDVVCEQTSTLPVTFDGHVTELDPFEKTYKTFLLCDEGCAAITALHDKLYDGPHRSEFNAAYPFTPHMTIGSYTAQTEAEQVDISALGHFPIKGQVCSLALVQLEDGELTTLKTASLIT
ncbi:2'-5' RNA ligase family protein [Tateyamaria sp. syn59]|uniref:2'-5' RNA ligase family protein n=1 Tax=Tateyamaria sp. syn59 TaxID=2576942 RepID=UPI0011BFBC78|nr:2'-5' RNA ligase family protein [Tateyamaria sp. syn59]